MPGERECGDLGDPAVSLSKSEARNIGAADVDCRTLARVEHLLDHVIAVPYELASSAESFIEMWNSDPHCVAVAVAAPAPEQRAEYAGELLDAFFVVLGALSSGVAGNALYDLLVNRLSLGRRKRVTYRQTVLQDGTTITELTTTEN